MYSDASSEDKELYIPILSVLEQNFGCVGVCKDGTHQAFSFSNVDGTVIHPSCQESIIEYVRSNFVYIASAFFGLGVVGLISFICSKATKIAKKPHKGTAILS